MQKQIILGLFVILILFSVTTVSAEDNQTVGDDFAVMDVNTNTFTDISTKLASTTGVLYLNNQTYTGNSEITITKSITIDGASQSNPNSISILDGQNSCRIFKIMNNGPMNPITVTLKNLVLINGNVADNQWGAGIYSTNINKLTLENINFLGCDASCGGALYVTGSRTTFNVNNCNFVNNNAFGNGAGAVYIYSSTATFNNCNFVNNSALRTNETGYSGGAIYSSGKLTVNNCLFENNTGLYGGAIINDGSSATVKNSKFISNVAVTNSGSAIYNYESWANLEVSNCTFEYNVANLKGSGIYNFKGTVNVYNSTFKNNEAKSSALLFNDGGKLYVSKSQFEGNVGVSGSIIYNSYTTWGYETNPGILIINQSNFNYNIPVNGTEIYNEATLKVYSSNLTGNYTLIQNYGNLTLENNNLNADKYLTIYNEGKILSQLKLTVLDNSTVKSFIGDNVTVSAILVDDNNNTIGDKSFKFIINGLNENPVLYKNGTYIKTVKFQESGLYPVGATISSNDYALESGAVDILPKANLKISASNITYGEITNIDVSGSNVSSFDILVLDINRNKTVYNASRGLGNVNLSNLNADKYLVIVNFKGDSNFSPVTNSTTFEVFKSKLNLTVKVDNITYGENAFCEIKLTNITTNITLTIGGVIYNINLTNGIGNLTVYNLDAGNYTVVARFDGNDNYFNCSNSTNFEVFKSKLGLIVEVSNITHGEEAVCEFKLGNLTTSILVIIGGVNYTVNIANGSGNLTVSNLDAGNYTVVASFGGSDNYFNCSNSTNFEVSKIKPTLTVSADNIIYGEDAVITVNLDGIFGEVNVYINNETHVIILTNTRNNIKIADLDAGNYTVYASFAGNKNYLSTYNSTIFNVSKTTPNLTITANNITYGENITCQVNLENITTKVNVTIGGVNYTVNIVNGSGNLIVSNLNAGNYTILVDFLGNENYLNVFNSTSINVSKANIKLNVTTDNITYGEDLICHINCDKSFNVNVTILDKNYTVSLNNGTSILKIPNLNAGNYTLAINYGGCDNYLPASVLIPVEIKKANIKIVIKADNITYGENVICKVYLDNSTAEPIINSIDLNEDEVNVSVNNVVYPVKLNNGFGQISIPNLNTGTYIASVSYLGDQNYLPANNSTTFNVRNANLNLNVTVDNTTYGEVVKGNITLSKPLNGTATVKINDDTFNVTINNGVGLIKLNSTFKPANYTVNVTFNVTNYNPASNTTIFSIKPINITTSNITVPYGVGGVIKLNLSKPLNTTAMVSFNNRDYSVDFINGVANFTIPQYCLPGNYTFIVDLDSQNATGIVKVTPHYNMTIEKIVSTINAKLYDDIVFTIIVRNNDYAVYNITVTDLLDTSKFEFIKSVASSGFYDVSSGIWNVQINKTETLNITVKLLNAGLCVNTAKLTIDGFNTTLNSNATVFVNGTYGNSNNTNNILNSNTNKSNITENINSTVNSDIGILKTANPILLLLLVIFLMPLRRKFKY